MYYPNVLFSVHVTWIFGFDSKIFYRHRPGYNHQPKDNNSMAGVECCIYGIFGGSE